VVEAMQGWPKGLPTAAEGWAEGVVWVFPGQGSQTVGMAADLWMEPALKATFEEASDALGQNVVALMRDGPQEVLTRTENAQPALLVAGVAAARWRQHTRDGEQPVAAAGHSLGEYTAACVAGALDFADAVRLVQARGRAMAAVGQRVPGGMSAVLGLEFDALEAVAAAHGVVLANDNAAGQGVLSGPLAALDAAEAAAKAAGAKRVVRLPVSGAFHSPSMAPVAEDMAARLAELAVHDPQVPVLSNASALPMLTAEDVRTGLVAQIVGRVRWREINMLLKNAEVGPVLELGPGRVLSNLAQRAGLTVA
jgi:[acyl-carrier-protein] S-malonyltransferase